MNVAIVYDWVHTVGGAERILQSLHELFPKAPLFTSVYDNKAGEWAKKFTIITSFLQKFPFAKSHHHLLPLFTPVAFESFDFSQFDLVISVTSNDAKGIITSTNTLHICYLLTPTRYLWSHYDFYFKYRFFKILTYPFVNYLRKWDMVAVNRPDYLISISETVKKRALKFYQKKSEVIYPPVDTGLFYPNKNSKGKYFLIVSRLVPYKHLEYSILACNELRLPLIIVGGGRARKNLQNMAGSTIKFTGNLTDRELIRYYQNCRAVIIPAEEDFGIVSVEAQASGKPVIAFSKGGSLETLVEGKTGLFFTKQTKNSIKDALVRFNSMTFEAKECINNSKKYDKEIFKKEFLNRVGYYRRLFFATIKQ